MSKSFVFATTFVFVFGLVAISNISTAAADAVVQEEAKSVVRVVAAPSTAPVQESSPSDMPVAQDVVTPDSVIQESVLQDPVPVPMAGIPAPAPAHAGCCDSCCNPCSCPVEMKLCLVDNCGCSHEVCVKVPACCVGQAPQVSWRDGILGRKIAMLCWPCCDERVKVVIPVFGGPRVFNMR